MTIGRLYRIPYKVSKDLSERLYEANGTHSRSVFREQSNVALSKIYGARLVSFLGPCREINFYFGDKTPVPREY